jgi:hypothetical protein
LYADYVGGVVVRHTSFFYFQLACCLFWHRNMQYVNTLHTVEYWNFVKTQNLLIIMINHFLKLSSKSKILISNKNIYKLSFWVCAGVMYSGEYDVCDVYILGVCIHTGQAEKFAWPRNLTAMLYAFSLLSILYSYCIKYNFHTMKQNYSWCYIFGDNWKSDKDFLYRSAPLQREQHSL